VVADGRTVPCAAACRRWWRCRSDAGIVATDTDAIDMASMQLLSTSTAAT
jgi:hypothetical protein